MGKLFDAIKKHHDVLIKMQNEIEKNYLDTMKFDKAHEMVKHLDYVNYFQVQINQHTKDWFGSEENFKQFLRNNANNFENNGIGLPTIVVDSDGTFDLKSKNLEVVLDSVEQALGEKKTNQLLEKINSYTPPIFREITHPFEPLINAIKYEMYSYDFAPERVKEIEEALKYANDEVIIEKSDNKEVEKAIDYISLTRDTVAKKQLVEYAEEKGIDGEKLAKLSSKNASLTFAPKKGPDQDFLHPFIEDKPIYSQEFKNKILALDNYINQKDIFKNPQAGESGSKEYGFIDYFDKAYHLKDLIANHQNITDLDEKVENLNNIVQTTNELKEITKQYDDVINYIKENFDISKIALPGNVYSGRRKEFLPGNYEEFAPNLPPRWDKENAPYGVILNGFAQLKKSCQLANVSLLEYMEDPVKCYLKGAKEFFKDEEEKYALPSNDNNPLGKRMAHVLLMPVTAYTAKDMAYTAYSRGIEFLNTTSDLDKNTIPNLIKTQAGLSFFATNDHSNRNMFGPDDNQSMKNLFALGNKTDNLFQTSTNYYDDKMNRGTLANTYNAKISSMKNVNPLNESRRVLATIKDYLTERRNMYVNKAEILGNEFLNYDEPHSPGSVMLAAKTYFNDYLYRNNINILDLDKKQRKEIMKFMNDPVEAFKSKYPKHVFNQGENFNTLKESYKAANKKMFNKIGKDFNLKFQRINDSTAGLNSGKNIQTILNDNRGGFFERNFGWSSKEYKALVESVKASTDQNSPTFGDLSASRFFAQKYLEHKLPLGADENSLSENEKRRVEFCRLVLRTGQEMEVEEQKDNNVYLAKDNLTFQNQLKKDADLGLDNDLINNNNIIVNELTNEI